MSTFLFRAPFLAPMFETQIALSFSYGVHLATGCTVHFEVTPILPSCPLCHGTQQRNQTPVRFHVEGSVKCEPKMHQNSASLVVWGFGADSVVWW